ncbi:HAD family hydrolase [Falsirhodobacter xinxiangensis]|uniref:HAD family hydrolase n=1 Tax=Falsirhodobacter xinxiangensis TaxID=2530049 RepID=UPI0010AADFE4|nr:HAD family hydrolase [Rhodobacter xinxiangensis]
MIEGIIFDKDGTLFDFRKSWGGWSRRLLEALSDDPRQQHAMGRAIGYDIDTQDFDAGSPVIAGTPDEIAALLLPFLPHQQPEALIARMNTLAASAPMAEAVPLDPLLTRLRERGLRIGLATNDAEAPARAHLAAHDLTGHFDFIAGFDSGFGGKPAPGQLVAFTRATGIDRSRVAMVGDSRHDLEAGRRAGMHTVAVLTGIAGEAELAPHADTVLADIGALPGWLDSL